MTEETRDDQELALRAQHNSVPDFNTFQELKFSQEVVQISCGHSHGLLLSAEGMVYSFGSNQFGQRGTQAVEAFSPTLIIKQKASFVSAGLYHSTAIIDGLAFAWGRGSEGQLGMGDFECRDEPKRVPSLQQLSAIACGGSHTLFLTNAGQVVSCGDNTWGQLGQTQSNSKPMAIDLKKKVTQISAGLEHSIFLTQNREVFICGNNLFGQCGKEGVSNLRNPTQLQLKDDVDKIFASLGTFSAIKTQNDQILIWGTGSWGHCRKPTLIQDICTLQGQNILTTKFKNLILGDNYGITLDSNGKMHLLGTQKLPDLNSSFQKLECTLLKIQKGSTMGGGNRFVIMAQNVEQDSFDLLLQENQQRDILSTVFQDCKRCQEMELKCSQLTNIICEKDNLIEHIRKEQAQMMSEIEKQQKELNEKQQRINELELEKQTNSRTFREKYGKNMILVEASYESRQQQEQLKQPKNTNRSSNKTEQPSNVQETAQLAQQRNPSYQKLGQIVGTYQKNAVESQLISKYQSQAKLTRSITPVEQGDHTDQSDNLVQRFIENNSSEKERVMTQQETSQNMNILQNYLSQQEQPIDEEDKTIRQNLNKSRGLIQSINSILTEFRSLNQKPLIVNQSEQKKVQHSHSKTAANIFYMPSKENVTPTLAQANPNTLIKTYFQRIEQLQQNIAKSKNELKKSLEANKVSMIEESKPKSIDPIPISMNFRKHSQNVGGAYRSNGSGTKSVERIRDQKPREIVQASNKTDRERSNEDSKRKSIINRQESRKTELIQNNDLKVRTLF